MLEHNKIDLELFQAANDALDEHILSIAGFQFELDKFRRLQEVASKICACTPHIVMSKKYRPNKDCHWRDNGCAVSCLGAVYSRVKSQLPPRSSYTVWGGGLNDEEAATIAKLHAEYNEAASDRTMYIC